MKEVLMGAHKFDDLRKEGTIYEETMAEGSEMSDNQSQS
jgi:hypothetical protein